MFTEIPPETEYILCAIGMATARYFYGTGSYPQSLEDLYHLPVAQANAGTKHSQIGELPLEGIHYTSEFSDLRGADEFILAYAPSPSQNKWAVLYHTHKTLSIIRMRSNEELEAELSSLRKSLAKGRAKTQQ